MKRIISILLILTLGFSVLPTAFSDGEEALYQPVGEEEILAEIVDVPLDEILDETVPDACVSEEPVLETEFSYGSLPDDYSVPPYFNPYKLLLSTSGALPEKYDAREFGYVTSVKDQGSYGTCWAFTLMAMAETNILKKYSAPSDLAEMQLVWFYYNGTRNERGEFNDPLNNFGGDHGYLKPGTTFYNILTLGGNLGTGLTTQASWIGVIPEDELTQYDTASISNIAQNGLPYSYAFEKDCFHPKNARIANIETDIDTVKQMILDYGAVGVSYMQSSTYMNGNAYYHPTGTGGTGHAVTIVGWDDNYPVENFSESYRPQHNGAWLIKNSWGKNAGDGGYFWMSYETRHGSGRTNAYAGEYEPSETYDYCYQYDGGFYTMSRANSGKYIYTANVYTAQHDELISAVSFWSTRQTNVPYVVYIVSEPKEDRPMSGKVLFSKAGLTAQAGYYSETLAQPVYVSAGERFSVIVRFENTTGGSFSYEYDADYSSDARYGSESAALPGQSYSAGFNNPITEKSTAAWNDLSASGYNNRIKAFTVVPEEKTLGEGNVALPHNTVTYDGTEQKPEVQVSYFGKTLKEGLDYLVTYSDNVEPGLASVTVTGSGGFSGSVTKHFVIKARQELAVTISRDHLKVRMTAQITVSGAAGECTFSTSAPSVAKVNSDGIVYALNPGTTTITVTAAETEEYGETSCQIPITVVLTGDVNTDRQINSLDFVTLAKWLKDKSIPCDTLAADADGNSVVNMDDAILLMKHLAGADVSL